MALDYIRRFFYIPPAELRKIIKDFHSEMSKGLAGKKSSLKMLPVYVDRPSGNEKGKFIAIDLGGTNLRVLELGLKGAGRLAILREKKFVLGEKIITSTARKLFDFIADCVKDLIQSGGGGKKGIDGLGFTFSFPIKQTGIASGMLIHWTKEFTAKGVEGKDVVKLLNDALERKGLKNIKVSALANDTVGTLVARSYKDRYCDIGVILGTGTNACYREKMSKITKWKGKAPRKGRMIINMEWGNFNLLRQSSYDMQLDNASENRGKQILEKMVSGKYLGEISRIILMDMIKRKVIFKGSGPSALSRAGSFKTEYMSRIQDDHSPDLSQAAEILRKLGLAKSTLEDRMLVKQICAVVSTRGARIAAAAMASVVTRIDPGLSKRHTLAVDGSVFEKYSGFAKNIKAGLREIFGNRAVKIKMALTKDGSGKGSAIVAALGKALLIFILVFCFAFPSYAAPCYGTKMPKKKEFFAGAEAYSIFKRYLKDQYGKLRSAQEFVLLSYGVFDWLSIDLKGGAGFVKQHPVGSDELDYPTSFAGGYGLRFKLYDKKDYKMVLGFQHISVHPESIHLGSVKHKAILDDWQVSVLVSREFSKFTPYLGTRWSRIDYIHWVGEDRKREMSDLTRSIGFIFGLNLPLTKKIWLNLEGQLFDSEAAACSLNYSF